MSKSINLKAYAKVNLALDVTGKREDGYHMVRMIMQSVRLFDRITLKLRPDDGITLSSNLPYLPVDERNLVWKAIDMIRNKYQIKEGISAHIDKHIPVAAGMGGGSSDAAAALVGMNMLLGLRIPRKELLEYGLTLGADIPFCITRGTALAEGIGEILTPLPRIPDCWFVLVKPAFSMSTKFVYQNLVLNENTVHPDVDGMVEALKDQDLSGVTCRMGNVLEQVTAEHFPAIIEIKEKLVRLGAENSLMSGSGSTVFGIFTDEKKAKAAAADFRSMPEIKMAAAVAPFYPLKRS